MYFKAGAYHHDCIICGKVLPPRQDRDGKMYCSGACKQKGYRIAKKRYRSDLKSVTQSVTDSSGR